MAATSHAPAQGRTADQVDARLNQTGRAMPMTVPLVDNGVTVRELLIRIDADDRISVSRNSLKEALQDRATPATLAAIAAGSGMISLDDMRRAGLDISFDKQRIALVIGLTTDQRKTGDISFARGQPISSGTLARPAILSGYLNLFAQSDYLWEIDQNAVRLEAEGVLRLGSFVFETEASIENSIGTQTCPIGAYCFFDHDGGVKRRGSRVVYDMPEMQNRLVVGDARLATTSFQRAADVLGVTLEHAPAKLDPYQPIRSTGGGSFIMERPGSVDVLINGALTQRLYLPAGRHNLRDLPLRPGPNQITLVIKEDTGVTHTVTFDAYSANALLKAGKSEWSASAGVPSFYRDGEIDYADNRFLASAFFRYGLTNEVTVEIHAQADNDVAMAGVGGAVGSPFGLWGLQIAASQTGSDIGAGAAARLTWDILSDSGKESFHILAEVHSPDFRTPGQTYALPTGIIYPVFDSIFTASAIYSRQITNDWLASVTARYDVANDRFFAINAPVAHGDRYHVDLSLTRPISESTSLTATVGYSNEIYNRPLIGPYASGLDNTEGEFWGGIQLFWRPHDRTFVVASADTLNQRSIALGSYQTANALDSWSTSVSTTDDRMRGQEILSGSTTYRSQRFEATLGLDSGFQVTNNAYTSDASGQRARVRLGTAIVFAGDKVGITAPVRGEGGFAILSPHESLGDRTITAGPIAQPRAKSDAFGPAIVTGISPYMQQSIAVDAADLPVGYSLGASGFDLRPPYKAGYNLEVGSGYSVSALGELRTASGEPLSLVAGIATNGTREVTVFTNQGGRFAADGLAEGRWTLTMETDAGPLAYTLAIPAGARGLVNLGALAPTRR